MTVNEYLEILKHREEAIEALSAGHLTKTEFLTHLYDYFLEIGYKPDKGLRSFEQGIVDYQYYNTMAKYHMMMSGSFEFNNPRLSKQHKDQALDYYSLKDQTSMVMVELKAYAGIEAYYLEMHSQSLEGSLFEIVFLDEKYVVLHSKDKRLQYRLSQHGVFLDYSKPSVIETYVNKRY